MHILIQLATCTAVAIGMVLLAIQGGALEIVVPWIQFFMTGQ
jgi:hypothetical protein